MDFLNETKKLSAALEQLNTKRNSLAHSFLSIVPVLTDTDQENDIDTYALLKWKERAIGKYAGSMEDISIDELKKDVIEAEECSYAAYEFWDKHLRYKSPD